MFLYDESGLDERLQATVLNCVVQYCIYGDLEYILNAWLHTGHGTGLDMNGEDMAYDLRTSCVRNVVE